MARLIAVVLLASCVASAPDAAAFERPVATRSIGSVAFAGDSVLSAEARGRDAIIRRTPLDGAPTSVIFTAKPPSTEEDVSISRLRASAEGYAFALQTRGPAAFGGGSYVGRVARFGAEPTSRFGSCGTSGIDIDGPLAVGGSCGVRLIDLRTDDPPVELAPEPASSPELAGPFVSWLAPSPFRIVVYDREAQRVAYEVPITAHLDDYDLQADGAVAFVLERLRPSPRRPRYYDRTEHVYWSTPAHPAPRRVRLPPATSSQNTSYHIRLAAGRLAWMRATQGSREAVVGTIRLGARRPRRIDPYAYAPSLAFDGRRLAWVSRRRGRLLLIVEEV